MQSARWTFQPVTSGAILLKSNTLNMCVTDSGQPQLPFVHDSSLSASSRQQHSSARPLRPFQHCTTLVFQHVPSYVYRHTALEIAALTAFGIEHVQGFQTRPCRAKGATGNCQQCLDVYGGQSQQAHLIPIALASSQCVACMQAQPWMSGTASL